MALICRTYECPTCLKRYDIRQERDEGSPDTCPLCGVTYEAPMLHVPGGFHFRDSAKVRAIEEPVRQYMDTTVRIAEEQGNPALKVTNLRDNVRPGETYAMPQSVPQPSQDYQRLMAGGMPVGFGQGAGAGMGGDAVSPQQLIAGVRADGGGIGAAPIIQQMVGNPMAPHKRMTGRFVRPK